MQVVHNAFTRDVLIANLEHLEVVTAGPAAATGERPWFRGEGPPVACKIPASGDGCLEDVPGLVEV